jgi:hypothetical protein
LAAQGVAEGLDMKAIVRKLDTLAKELNK